MRTYIRAALEYLDLEYLYGQAQVPQTEQLLEADLAETEEEPASESLDDET